MTHSSFGLLRTQRFFPLFLTQLLGALNDSLFKNALFILIAYTVASQAKADVVSPIKTDPLFNCKERGLRDGSDNNRAK